MTLRELLSIIAVKLNIYDLCAKIGVNRVIYNLVCKDEINGARKYFEENKDIIQRNLELLADDKSKEVYHNLITFRKTRSWKYMPEHGDTQYFANGIVDLGEKCVFVDCGAYTGDTYEVFKHYVDNRFEGYIAFEPENSNYEQLVNATKSDSRVTCIKAGCWDKNTVLSFCNDGSGSCVVEGDGATDGSYESVSVVAIDEQEECANCTCIKMDIEGSELKALAGAKNTIARNRPILLICIYHSNEDMLNIIQYIQNLNLNYRFYIRHHSNNIMETVLYAIPN